MKNLKQRSLKINSKVLFVFENNKVSKTNSTDTTTTTITMTGTGLWLDAAKSRKA